MTLQQLIDLINRPVDEWPLFVIQEAVRLMDEAEIEAMIAMREAYEAQRRSRHSGDTSFGGTPR